MFYDRRKEEGRERGRIKEREGAGREKKGSEEKRMRGRISSRSSGRKKRRKKRRERERETKK